MSAIDKALLETIRKRIAALQIEVARYEALVALQQSIYKKTSWDEEE